MEIFSQNKLLRNIILLLVLINLLLIGAFVWKDYFRKSPEDRDVNDFNDVSSVLKKELNLTENQAEQIKKLREEFYEKEKKLEGIIRSDRDSLNAVMFNKSTNEETAKALARRISDNEYNMEMLRFEQAQKFKSLCTSEQLEKFEGLVKEIRDYFKPGGPPKDRQDRKEKRQDD